MNGAADSPNCCTASEVAEFLGRRKSGRKKSKMLESHGKPKKLWNMKQTEESKHIGRSNIQLGMLYKCSKTAMPTNATGNWQTWRSKNSQNASNFFKIK